MSGDTTLDPGTAVGDEYAPTWLPDGSGLIVLRAAGDQRSPVRWPMSDGHAAGTPVVLGSEAAGPDLRFELAPDGRSVLAWSPGSPVVLVPLS